MAATVGRLTGTVGVCLSTLGPGATNFVTSASYALLAGLPVLFITGQKPIKQSKQGRFQIIDIVRMMEPVTKLSRQIVDGNNVPHLVREAFRTALTEKPGPVHLELPEDVAGEPALREPFDVTNVTPPGASQSALRRAAELIMAAERPLLCVAAGANRHQTRPELEAFVNGTGLYFVSTQMGKGVVDERHPRYLGTTALSAGDFVHRAIEKADVILNVGHDLSEKPPFLMRGARQVIHLAYSPAEMDDVYFPQHEVIGCTAANVGTLAEMIEPSPDWDFAHFARVKAAIENNVFCPIADDRFPLCPERVVHEVRAAVPSDGIVSLDNGMYKIWFARNYRAHAPNTLLLDNALATMGAGLPVAIGAKLMHPDRMVVAVAGDGGFLMNSQEMETAVRLGLDLVVVVLRDDAYGMIRWKQAALGFPDFGLEFGNPDFVRYAESYGAHGHRVDRVGGLEAMLREAKARGGVHLIDVPIDYSQNGHALGDGLRARVDTL
jgi:acetolactate synthase-1/2/3 large subunit